MNRLFLPLFLCLVANSCSSGNADPLPKQAIETKLGLLTVEKDQKKDAEAVFLNKKKVLDLDEYSSSLWLSGPIKLGDKELFFVFQNSGGIACPGTYVVLEIKDPVGVSNTFGSCGETYTIKVVGNTLEIIMPTYVPHPDLLSKSELKRRLKSSEVFVWFNGEVTERKGRK